MNGKQKTDNASSWGHPKIIAAALVTLLLAAAAASPSQAAFATFPGENGKIVFFSERDRNAEIYTMNSDESDQTRLTENDSSDLEPEWSPDGTRILGTFKTTSLSLGSVATVRISGDGPTFGEGAMVLPT